MSDIRDLPTSAPMAGDNDEQRERYAVLVYASPDAISFADYDTELNFDVNPAYAELFGYSRHECIGKTSMEMGLWHNPDQRRQYWELLRRDGKVNNLLASFRRSDGTLIEGSIRAVTLRFEDRLCVLNTIRDVTEEARTRARLAASEARFRLLAENAHATIFRVALPSGRYEYVSPGCYEQCGYTPDDFYNVPMFLVEKLLTPEYVPAVREHFKNLITGVCQPGAPNGLANEIYYQIRRKNGERRWMLHRSTLVRDEAGKPIAVEGIVADITDSKRMEEELAASREYFAAIYNASPDPIFIVDGADRRLLDVNPAFLAFTGLAREQALSKTIESLGFVPSSLSPADVISQLESRGHLEMPEVRFTRADGQVMFCNASLTLFELSGKRCIMTAMRDITRDKLLQIERTRLDEQMRQAQKLESLGVLAGGIAHDFNNLLTAITGNLGLAQLLIPTDVKAANEHLHEAETAAIRARDLTHQLLTFARGGNPLKEIITLAPVVRESAGFALSGSRNRCVFDLPKDLWAVHADSGQVSQVIGNLILNADQAMPEPGEIHIRCENVPAESAPLGLAPGAYVKICIHDHGVGIPADIMPRIFDPFFSTKKRGSGLGLASAHSILKAHGGMLSAESKPGEGTCMSFWLPALPGREPGHVEARASAPGGRPLKVLVLDDEEPLRMMLEKSLTMIGHTVSAVADGEAALAAFTRALQENRPFDLAVLDLTIPGGMGGQEVLARMLALDPGLKAIASSGYATDPVMADYKTHGFSGRLAKPYRLADLEASIAACCRPE